MSLSKTPIVVVGMNRSGTKWLTNVLCNHSCIAGVQSERHNGILETNMLQVMDRKFDFRSDQDFAAGIELWTRSDFFRNSGVDQRVLFREPRPKTTLDTFVRVMEQAADQSGKPFWIQKTSPEIAINILPRLPNARVIVIQREFMDTIKSALQLAHIDGQRPSVFDAVYTFVTQSKESQRLIRRPDVMNIRFDELRSAPEATAQSVCKFLGVAYEPEMLEPRFTKNTSFPADKLHPAVEFVQRREGRIRALRWLLNLLPLWAIRAYSRTKLAINGSSAMPFIVGSFSELEAEMFAQSSEADELRSV